MISWQKVYTKSNKLSLQIRFFFSFSGKHIPPQTPPVRASAERGAQYFLTNCPPPPPLDAGWIRLCLLLPPSISHNIFFLSTSRAFANRRRSFHLQTCTCINYSRHKSTRLTILGTLDPVHVVIYCAQILTQWLWYESWRTFQNMKSIM